MATLAVAGPLLVLLYSVHQLVGARMGDFRPVLNDEVYYWHQIATAAAAGTGGGYYTTHEALPAVNAFRFGAHGPVYPLLAGAIASLVGWHRAAGPWLNMAWLAIGTTGFIALARPSRRQLALTAALLATFWPIPFWAASNMQESFHHGVALLLAGALVAVAARRRAGLITGWSVLTVAVLIRPSWAIVLPVLGIAGLHRRTWPRLAAVGLVSVALAAVAITVFDRIRAPLPGAFEFLSLARLDEGLAAIVATARANVGRLFNVGDDYDALEILLRAEYLAAATAFAVLAVTARRRARATPDERLHLATQSLQLVGIVTAMIVFYAVTNWAEHRVIAGHLLLATLVAGVAGGAPGAWLAGALVATNVLASPIYAESFRQNRSENLLWDRRSLRVFEEAIDGRIEFHPGAPPWCNTLLTSQYPPDLVALPPGIGISVIREAKFMTLPVRSRYLLLDTRVQGELEGHARLMPFASVAYGTLYLNLDARCPP